MIYTASIFVLLWSLIVLILSYQKLRSGIVDHYQTYIHCIFRWHSELKNRGVQDSMIACIDGCTGFDEAIKALYPKTIIQPCIVHQVRNTLKFIPHQRSSSCCAIAKINLYCSN